MSRDILSKRVVWLNQILAHLYVKSGRISVKIGRHQQLIWPGLACALE